MYAPRHGNLKTALPAPCGPLLGVSGGQYSAIQSRQTKHRERRLTDLKGPTLDPHPADPETRLEYLEGRLALCWRVMLCAAALAVVSWLLADAVGGSLSTYLFGGACLVSAFCAVSGALMDGERERLKRLIAS